MKVEFTTEARDDFFEAAEYYESNEMGLGSRMRDEISKIIRRSIVVVAVIHGSRKPGFWHARLNQ